MPRVRREYHVDLREPPARRWREMIAQERDRARDLIRTCHREAEILARQSFLGKLALSAARKLVPTLYDLVKGAYAADIAAWAEGTGLAREDLIFANLIYEVSQAPCCTAVALNLPGGCGVAHVRNMDWAMTGIGPHTCLIHYHGPRGSFTAVGWPTYVGVLSGVAPGRFSATINQAPLRHWPSTQWPASFLLRRAFEDCASFGECVKLLRRTPLAASTLLMLAGTRTDEAAVIEHTGKRAVVREMERGYLAVANHYVSFDLRKKNGNDEEWLEDSRARYEAALLGLGARRGRQLLDLLHILGREPVLHGLTAHRMVFIPKTGKHYVAYRDTDRAVALWLRLGDSGTSA